MATMSPDGRQVVTASFDRTARLWDFVDERLPRRQVHAGRVRALTRAADGRVLSVGDDATLAVWQGTEAGHTFPVAALPSGVTIAADGQSALVCSFDSVARRHRLDDGTVIGEYAEDRGLGVAAVFLSDGRVLTSGLGNARQVFAASGGDGVPFGPGRMRTYALASAPRAKLVAGVGWGPNLTIWDEQGERRAHFALDPAWPRNLVRTWSYAVAFSPDEARIVVGSGDGRARVFDLADGRPLNPTTPLVLDGHGGRVLAVAWSPDGSLLATAGSDGAARLWAATGGEPVAVLRGHRGAVNAVVFTGDGRLLSGGDDGVVQAWVTSKAELLELARRRLAR
jgi:WD40 repeat protein